MLSYIVQSAITFYGSTGIYKTTHKSGLWSLLEELNNVLKDKKYLIKVIILIKIILIYYKINYIFIKISRYYDIKIWLKSF